jgi:hypothetical protein
LNLGKNRFASNPIEGDPKDVFASGRVRISKGSSIQLASLQSKRLGKRLVSVVLPKDFDGGGVIDARIGQLGLERVRL